MPESRCQRVDVGPSGFGSHFRAQPRRGRLSSATVACAVLLLALGDAPRLQGTRPALSPPSARRIHACRRWMLRYTEALGSRLGLRVRWVEAPGRCSHGSRPCHTSPSSSRPSLLTQVPFDGSWALAGEEGAVDLVATNVAPSPQRRAEAVGAAFSDPFMYERRALRVREADAGRRDLAEIQPRPIRDPSEAQPRSPEVALRMARLGPRGVT